MGIALVVVEVTFQYSMFVARIETEEDSPGKSFLREHWNEFTSEQDSFTAICGRLQTITLCIVLDHALRPFMPDDSFLRFSSSGVRLVSNNEQFSLIAIRKYYRSFWKKTK